MLCILNDSTDPFFNMAAEEFLLKECGDDIFRLWFMEPTISVGKHQNTLAEINMDYVKAKKLKVVRRLSGGGAVFHDLGNLNYTFVINGEEGNLINFERFTHPILEVLQQLSVNAKFEGRNDLTIEGRKFSGNAEGIYKNRVLHHGTLLFSSVMADVSGALKVSPSKFEDKAVKSVQSRVTNISEHLLQNIDVHEFKDMILRHVQQTWSDCKLYCFSESDLQKINQLVKGKYSTWEWNFGSSPRYNFQKTIKTKGGHVEFYLNVERGMVLEARIMGDYFSSADVAEIEKALCNLPHRESFIRSRLSAFDIDRYFHRITLDELISGMF